MFRVYPLTQTNEFVLVYLLFPVFDDVIYLVSYDRFCPPHARFVQHVQLDHLTNTLVKSPTVPFDFQGYRYETCFLHGNQIGFLASKKHEHGPTEDLCFVFKYSDGAWSKTMELSLGKRESECVKCDF
jgi:hypothetical protein